MESDICIIGFTGTRIGINREQKRLLVSILCASLPDEVHHGDCIGADEQFHELVCKYVPRCRIIIHPPKIDTYRAYCEGDIYLPEEEYLKRDRNVVDHSNLLLACPKSLVEAKRGSGTWYTVRYARHQEVPVKILYRNGTVVNENLYRSQI